jgi:hypothetical protein
MPQQFLQLQRRAAGTNFLELRLEQGHSVGVLAARTHRL